MTEQELYNLLNPLSSKFEAYKNKQLHAVSADDVEQMKPVYTAINELYIGALPRLFNASCSSCVADAFKQMVLVWDRLEKVYSVSEQAVEVEEPIKPMKKKGVKKDGK